MPGTSTAINCANPAPSAALPCATIDASGLVTQLKYDSAGDLASVSVPDGNGAEQATTTYSFDNDGEETSTTSPDGNLPGSTAPTTANYTTITAYNADGQTTSDTLGASGSTVTPRTTSYGYDGDGNQTTETDARGQTTTTAYDLDGLATLVTDPDGNSSLTCYDGDGNAAQTVPAAGVAANHLSPASCPASYPAAYNPAVTSNWLAGDATLATFNAAGEQIASYTPLPASQSGPPNYETTSYAYDGNANLIKTISPPDASGGPGQVVTDTYDDAGELTSETTGSGATASTIAYCYDLAGDTTAVIYGDGNAGGAGAMRAVRAFHRRPGPLPSSGSGRDDLQL